MCGIVGLVGSRQPDARELLVRMREQLVHRGPDDAGAWWSADGLVGLGHRRLAILDLSPAGHQPMQDHSGRLVIVFNGEIYNHPELRTELEQAGHRFHSRTDTEVILESYRRWGMECLSHFNGMFAFALFDAERRKLFLARDRAGEKPLFYWRQGSTLAFASELKALLADRMLPRRLDMAAVDAYFAYGYVRGAQCILQGFNKLPPGHSASLDLDTQTWRVQRYWALPEPVAVEKADPEELTARLETLLRDAVGRQLVADVPVGILLSGGLDSSLVTALAASQSSQPVRTFTVSFPGHAQVDESARARVVASHCGAQHTELPAQPASWELLPRLAAQYDEPLGDSSLLPTFLVSELIRRHATVALGGDGGDELFAGYPQYAWLQRQDVLRHCIPSLFRPAIGAVASRLPVGFRGRNFLLGLGGSVQHGISCVNLFFERRRREQLLRPLGSGPGVAAGAEQEREALAAVPEALPERAMRADFQAYLPDDILVKVDRASMLTSLEVRAPWLDYHIIEFAFSRVPNTLRATCKETKLLPRLLGQKLLPKETCTARKRGFSLPLGDWLAGPWKGFVEGVLAGADPRIFSPAAVRGVINGQRRGMRNAERVFALLMFELWRKQYDVGLG